MGSTPINCINTPDFCPGYFCSWRLEPMGSSLEEWELFSVGAKRVPLARSTPSTASISRICVCGICSWKHDLMVQVLQSGNSSRSVQNACHWHAAPHQLHQYLGLLSGVFLQLETFPHITENYHNHNIILT